MLSADSLGRKSVSGEPLSCRLEEGKEVSVGSRAGTPALFQGHREPWAVSKQDWMAGVSLAGEGPWTASVMKSRALSGTQRLRRSHLEFGWRMLQMAPELGV